MARSATTPKRPLLRRSSALALSVVLLSVIAILVLTIFSRTDGHVRTVSRRVNDQEAIRLAEAGVEKAVWCLNNPSNTTDCPGNPSYTGETNVALGRGHFTTTVSGSGRSRAIDAYGTVSGALTTTTKHVQVRLATTAASESFQYGVQTGTGGVTMENNAFVDGNLYSAGSVIGANGSHIDGDAVLTPSDPTQDAVSDPSVSPLQTLTVGSNNSSNDWLAQSFVPSVTDKIYSLYLKIAKHNAPTSNITLMIYSNNGDNPDSDLSDGGQALTVSVPNDSPSGWEDGWTTQTFNPPTNPVLAAGQKYWLVIKASSTNSTKYWVVVRSPNDNSYAEGTAKLDGDTSTMFSACAGGCDIAFQVNMGGVPPTLKVPNVEGNGYARTIDSTTLGGKAYYQNLAGTVKAAGGSDTCSEGESGPNCFDDSDDQPTADFPISSAEIAQMETPAVGGGTTACSPSCTITDGTTIGPRKYDGNVTIDGTVTLAGTIWVKGNLTFNEGAVIKLADAYGGDSGVVIIDNPDDAASGKLIASNDSCLVRNSTSDTYVMAIATSQSLDVNDPAANINNNFCKADLHPNAAAVIYVPNGLAKLSNNTALKEITAESLYLLQNVGIAYETGLASIVFSSGPGGSWVYRRGSYQVVD
ncbi:MAG: hypothetical protein HYY50_05670 [Candidatus Kerfeldbacteria bacterium]|nr:hypothetical protein [Candidatus Kerfeldbacteria bacterium]